MVYRSKLLDVEIPKIGLIHYLFSNKDNIRGDKPVLVDALDTSRYLTYSQLEDRILRFGAGLQDVCGFQIDDVLALFSSNRYDYSIPFFGAIAAGGATTTVNPNYNAEELSYQLIQANAKIIICQEDNIKIALDAGARAGIEKKNIFIFGESQAKGIQPFNTALIGDRKVILEELSFEQTKEKVAVLCFSSGTTGISKGVMTTHSNLTANVAQYIAFEGKFLNADTDRILAVMPFFHIFGLMIVLNLSLYLGITSYTLSRFDIVDFCKTVQNHKITYVPVAPPICLTLAKHDVVSHYDLSSLKVLTSGGGPLSNSLAREVMARIPNATARQGYGLTETSPVAIAEHLDGVIGGPTGMLFPNMFAKLIDEDGKEVAQGESGELCLKGPNLMKGYVNNIVATMECIDDEGYFHTGDIAVVDENELFSIVDRKKELIKYKGFQVPPAELEGILIMFPGIVDCAVIGIYDENRVTELPRAYILLEKNIEPSDETAKAIMKFVSDRVVYYKRVRSVRFIDTIPRNSAGKIQRKELRDAAKLDEAFTSKL